MKLTFLITFASSLAFILIAHASGESESPLAPPSKAEAEAAFAQLQHRDARKVEYLELKYKNGSQSLPAFKDLLQRRRTALRKLLELEKNAESLSRFAQAATLAINWNLHMSDNQFLASTEFAADSRDDEFPLLDNYFTLNAFRAYIHLARINTVAKLTDLQKHRIFEAYYKSDLSQLSPRDRILLNKRLRAGEIRPVDYPFNVFEARRDKELLELAKHGLEKSQLEAYNAYLQAYLDQMRKDLAL